MSQDVYVAGVGMIPFAKPGASDPYHVIGARAIRAALTDTGLEYDKVQQVYAGYFYSDSCSGQCAVGGAEKFIEDSDNTYGGSYVTNPSGGLLSKGHPLDATGLAQCTELVHQLRGTADRRQVAGTRLALQHNLGLGGACVVTLYERV